MTSRAWPLLIVGAAGAAGLGLYLSGSSSRRDDADMPKDTGPIWPIAFTLLNGIGDSILDYRKSTGGPHRGVDLLADENTPVRAAMGGRVLRVEGDTERAPKDPNNRTPAERAGLFVDVMGTDGLVYRYLHLGRAEVKPGQRIAAGDRIGRVAATGKSGVLASRPHLHFEIRQSDWDRKRGTRGDYGEPLNPLAVLPLRLQQKSKA